MISKDALGALVRIVASRAVDLAEAVDPGGTTQFIIVARSGDEVQIKAVSLSKDEAKNLMKEMFESN